MNYDHPKHESTGTIEIFLSKSYELGNQEKKSANSKCCAEILLSLTSPRNKGTNSAM